LISLKTRDPELAKQRWKLVSIKVDAMLSAARRGVTVSLPSSLAKLTTSLDEEQREAFEAYLLTKLEEDAPDDETSTRKPLAPVQRSRFKSYFDAPPQGSRTARRFQSPSRSEN